MIRNFVCIYSIYKREFYYYNYKLLRTFSQHIPIRSLIYLSICKYTNVYRRGSWSSRPLRPWDLSWRSVACAVAGSHRRLTYARRCWRCIRTILGSGIYYIYTYITCIFECYIANDKIVDRGRLCI